MFVIANGGDFTSLSITIEADNPEASESDKRSSGTFFY
jgi:hypothetical protein